jgi:hypothetical protein
MEIEDGELIIEKIEKTHNVRPHLERKIFCHIYVFKFLKEFIRKNYYNI